MRSIRFHLRSTLLVAVLGGLLSVIVTAPADAATTGDVSRGAAKICAPVHARGVGQDIGGGKTVATISVGRFEVGTTRGEFSIMGVDPNGIASFAGPITFTSAVGTIVAQVTGTLDTTTGAFESTSTSLTGTGLFRGVSGAVTLRGTENLTTFAFTERITGRLCLPFRH
jgi:hypothetical protein